MAGNEWGQEDILIVTDTVIREPEKYQVILHNDDYTTMDFVIKILQSVFHKNIKEATDLTIRIHEHGTGLCGTFTREIAEAKVRRVHSKARSAGFPLKCTMEKV